MTFEVKVATLEEKSIVAHLMELYVYDLNSIAPESIMFELDSEGLFGYPRFERFWDEPNCRAYLFHYNGRPAGFCLTHDNPFYHRDEYARVIGEFCILRMYRNRDLGLQAAAHIMRDTPGYWEMRVIDDNKVAVHFWEKVLKYVAKDNYTIYNKNDTEWLGKVFVGKVK